MNTEALWSALRRGNVPAALGLLQPWLRTTVSSEADLLLQITPPDIRPHLSAMLLDLLSNWPKTLVGVPVQIYADRAHDTPPDWGRLIVPESPVCIVPVRGLVFCGWLSPWACLPHDAIKPREMVLKMERLHCLVALFRAASDLDFDNLVIPQKWWTDLFTGCQADVYLSAHPIHALPLALEVARLLADVDRGTLNDDRELIYITPSLFDWACKTATRFRAETERYIPNFDKLYPEPIIVNEDEDEDEDDI